ncbi:MAG: hypothetical protein M3P96_06350 [Actinomycetota bacterium]|nr:hypothetical protein [Actinomycetota bacterium]
MAPESDRRTIYIPSSLWRAARVKAVAEGRALSDVIRDLLRRWVDGEEEK